MLGLPYGQILVVGGTATMTLSGTAALMTLWTSNGLDSMNYDGDCAVQPDFANNRVKLNTPGIYEAMLDLVGTFDSSLGLIAQLRKNGATLIPNAKGKSLWATTKSELHLHTVFELTAADGAVLKLVTSGDTTGVQTPGQQADYGAQPKTMTAIDVMVSSVSGTPVFTLEEARLTVKRLR